MERKDFIKNIIHAIASGIFLSSCDKPIKKAIPYLIEPENIIPGEPYWVNSTFSDAANISRVKLDIRENGIIRTVSQLGIKQGLSKQVMASHIQLHHPNRLKNDKAFSLEELKKFLVREIQLNEKNTYIILSPVISPILKNLIKEAQTKYSRLKILEYRYKNYQSFANEYNGNVPKISLNNIKTIISINADFLHDWFTAEDFIPSYSEQRQEIEHYHIDYKRSITGNNANKCIIASPNEELQILEGIYQLLQQSELNLSVHTENPIAILVKEMVESIKNSIPNAIILCDSNNSYIQRLVKKINTLIKNNGIHILPEISINGLCYDNTYIQEFFADLNAHTIGSIICFNGIDIYKEFNIESVHESLNCIESRIWLNSMPSSFSNKYSIVSPAPHPYETYDVYEANSKELWISQKLFTNKNGFRIHELLSLLCYQHENTDQLTDAYLQTIIAANKDNWPIEKANILSKGFYVKNDYQIAAKSNAIITPEEKPNIEYKDYIISFYGNNIEDTFLESEILNPINGICIDKPAIISEALAEELQLKEGQIIIINKQLSIPVSIVKMQYKYFVNVHYSDYCKLRNNYTLQNDFIEGTIEPSKKIIPLGKTGIKLKEGQLTFRNVKDKHDTFFTNKKTKVQWAIAIDLNKCISCGTCILACSIENNIPTVGKIDILKNRAMHWIRMIQIGKSETDKPFPIMCQHCENAPCESVCPVGATLHSSEGLNQMVYNRCIGTRYCNNNCPFKARTFNYRDYAGNDFMGGNEPNNEWDKLSYAKICNPDVSIRSKGVIEKCSLCYHRIQQKKIKAKAENRILESDEIQTACMESCPASAITFGDLHDKNSNIAKLYNNERAQYLYTGSNALPSIFYLKRTI